MSKILARIGFAAALAVAAPAVASAAVIYSANLATGPIASPGVFSTFFNSPVSGGGTIAFQLQGYTSLDGDNYYRDNFTLKVNGVLTYAGSFDLGGGGSNVVTFTMPGPSSFVVAPVSTGVPTFAGGFADIVTSLNLVAGLNSLEFRYDSPGGAYAGPQGLGDEGWGVNGMTVTSAVPEPATWAMMLVGFAVLGYVGQRRRAAAPLAA